MIKQFKDENGNLHKVDYNELENKPTIPSKTSQLTKDDVYTKTETDGLLNSKASKDYSYDRSTIDSKFNDVDILLNQKAYAEDVYNKTEVDSKIANIQSGEIEVYSKTESDAKYLVKEKTFNSGVYFKSNFETSNIANNVYDKFDMSLYDEGQTVLPNIAISMQKGDNPNVYIAGKKDMFYGSSMTLGEDFSLGNYRDGLGQLIAMYSDGLHIEVNDGALYMPTILASIIVKSTGVSITNLSSLDSASINYLKTALGFYSKAEVDSIVSSLEARIAALETSLTQALNSNY